jgi:hypothetical protein
MPKRRSSTTQDINQIAVEILEEAVGEPAPITPAGKKNPAAADSGRAGVLKGGAAKAKVKAKGLPVKKPRP